ncbi:MAG: hypothetical protein QOF55_2606, partial [Thermoleophilaceae bacterium]|nr:hypothetical protein [Thermoleophilaceae bacterium]
MLRAPHLPRLDLTALGWAALAAALALLAGLLVGSSAQLAFDFVLVGVAAAVFVNRPYVALIGLLLALPASKGAPFDQRSILLDLLTLAGGGLALGLVARKLPGMRVALPLLLLLLIAIPTVRLLPGPVEIVPDYQLRLPNTGQPYLKTPSAALMDLARLGAVFVIFGLAAWTVRSVRRLEILIDAILVSSVIPIIYAFDQLATGGTVTRPGVDSPPAVEGTFTHPNHFAFYLVVVLTLALSRLLEARRLATRVLLGGLLVAGGACLFLTYTRSGWIGFGLAVLVMGALRHRALMLAAPVLLVLAAIALPGATDKVQQRFGDLTSQSEAASENSWSWRTGQWRRMLPYGSHKPLTGEGFGSYTELTTKRFGIEDRQYPTIVVGRDGSLTRGFSAHNDYVKMFVELGVPGLVLWCLVLIGLLGSALAARRVRALDGPATAMAAIAVMLMAVSASDNLQGYSVVLAAAFALSGALAGVAHAARQRREPAAAAVAAGAPALPLPPQPEPEPEPEPERPAEERAP